MSTKAKGQTRAINFIRHTCKGANSFSEDGLGARRFVMSVTKSEVDQLVHTRNEALVVENNVEK